MAKIGFFGGSFDPIHFGHIKLARELAVRANLQAVWFSPAKINPHKQNSLPTDIVDRLNMVALAIEDDPLFSLLKIEAEREGPSYTVDTLQWLVAQEKRSDTPREIVLILTDELVADFMRWKDPERIVSLVPLLIGSRLGSPAEILESIKEPAIRGAMQRGWCQTEVLPISSTELRRRLSSGAPCNQWIPQKVLDYIAQHKLYSVV